MTDVVRTLPGLMQSAYRLLMRPFCLLPAEGHLPSSDCEAHAANDYMTRHKAVEAAKGKRNLFPAHLQEQAVQQYIDTSHECYKSLTLPHEREAACRRQVFCVLCHQQRPHHDGEGNDLRARQLLLWIRVQMRAPQLVCPES